jgi:hypothetical protein
MGNVVLRGFTGLDVAGADGSPASVIQCSQDVEFSVGYTSDDADLKKPST